MNILYFGKMHLRNLTIGGCIGVKVTTDVDSATRWAKGKKVINPELIVIDPSIQEAEEFRRKINGSEIKVIEVPESVRANNYTVLSYLLREYQNARTNSS